jgi:hypothetical protein
MNFLKLTLVGDGSSDACLIPIIHWIMSNRFPDASFRVEFAKNLPPHREGLDSRINAAFRYYPCDILVIHRDAERETAQKRSDEIVAASVGVNVAIVHAIPVRMLESWLLCSEDAIRIAADNPNGKNQLCLPTINRIESAPDPKQLLFDALKVASELSGRRLIKFRVEQRRHRVAELIEDYAPLRSLASFQDFENTFVATLSPLFEQLVN